MWLLPTLRRPNSLRRFFDAYRETGAVTPGFLIIDAKDFTENELAYHSIELPHGWNIRQTRGITQGDKIREVWDEVSGSKWLGLIGDDCVPETQQWDSKLVAELNGWNFVSCDDGWQAPGRVGNCWVISGELARTIGYIAPVGMHHMFIDDVWEMIGREAQNWRILMDVKVRHAHVLKNEAPTDETHRAAYNQEIWGNDKRLFSEWREKEKPLVVDRILKLAGTMGARLIRADMSGMHIYIGTPTSDGKYEDVFVWALMQTMRLIENRGGQWSWGREKYNSDITLARSKIVDNFLKSNATHLLFIDADMGWEASAVERLVWAKKDFVGVAGPKKLDPLKPMQFAANYSDENGNALDVITERETICAEVSEVGAAFTLLSRSCVQKIKDAHPELIGDVNGNDVPFLFLPFVNNRKNYRGEDFAFCERWRELGGKVYLCPDIALSHVGSYTWHGSIVSEQEKVSQLIRISPQEAAE